MTSIICPYRRFPYNQHKQYYSPCGGDLLLFHWDNLGKTASSKVFMTNSVMNVCSVNGSPLCWMLKSSLKIGACTILPSDHIAHSSTKPRRILPPSSPPKFNLLSLSFLLDTKTKVGHKHCQCRPCQLMGISFGARKIRRKYSKNSDK